MWYEVTRQLLQSQSVQHEMWIVDRGQKIHDPVSTRSSLNLNLDTAYRLQLFGHAFKMAVDKQWSAAFARDKQNVILIHIMQKMALGL